MLKFVFQILIKIIFNLHLGWHNRLNKKANGSQLDLYKMAPLLFKEASFLDLQVMLLTEKKLRRHQRLAYKNNEQTINNLWDSLTKNEIADFKFLKKISYLYNVAC